MAYIAGMVVGNSDILHRRSLMRFHDGMTWLMQIGVFLTLGLLVFPSRLPDVTGIRLIVSAILIFAARPSPSTFACCAAGSPAARGFLWGGRDCAAPFRSSLRPSP